MIPKSYQQMHQRHPELMRAYEAFGDAARDAGPLSPREIALAKLAISIGAGLQGAAHSHCRKALQAGCSADDLRHVAILAAPTIGFPTMMRARSWVEDVLAKESADAADGSLGGSASGSRDERQADSGQTADDGGTAGGQQQP